MEGRVETILIADDDDIIRELLSIVLEGDGYQTVTASDGYTAVALAFERRPDAAIIDISMPGLDGFGVCRAIRADSRTATMPVLLLTAMTQTNARSQGLELGANDYITKPFDNTELLRRLRNALDVYPIDKTMVMPPTIDPLTKLLNRVSIEQELALLLDDNAPLSVMIMDVDHFENLNARHGHDAGDSILATVAAHVSRILRAEDIVGRLGSDSFIAILPGTGRSASLAAATRLQTVLDDATYPYDDESVTLTIGLTTRQPGELIDAITLIADAAAALHAAQERGAASVVHTYSETVSPATMPELPLAARALTEALSVVDPQAVTAGESIGRLAWLVGAHMHLSSEECVLGAHTGRLVTIGRLVEGATGVDVASQRLASVRLLESVTGLESVATTLAASQKSIDAMGVAKTARIVAAADMYVTLYAAAAAVSDERTRRQSDRDDVFGLHARLKAMAGVNLDSDVVTALLHVLVS